MLAFLAGKARAFRPDAKANVAMMFGLSLVPIIVATGAGIDFARGMMVHQRMSEALDAAALAVGNATSKPTSCSSSGDAASQQSCAALKTVAQQYFDQNYDHTKDSNYGTPAPVSISIVNQSVTLSSSLPLQLTLLGIAPLGVGAPNVTASSTVVWGQTKLWVALVLDNSGSMDQGDSGGSKMDALHDALTNSTYGLLKTLQAAAATDGDVNVGIVPFTRSVNIGKTAYLTSSYIDWGEWEAPPAGVTVSSSVGPGSNCPFTTTTTDWRGRTSISQNSPYGFYCMPSASNQSDNNAVGTIPSSGLICPGIDSGTYNTDHRDRYYNGCWTTDITTKITTSDATTPKTQKQNCSQVNSNSISCSNTGTPTTGSTTNTSSSSIVSGDQSASTTTNTTASSSNSDGSKSCSTSRGNTTCTWVRTVTTTTVVETISKVLQPYGHTWTPNAHSTWSGCIMDRQQKNKQTTVNGGTGYRTPAAKDYDEGNDQPAGSGSDDTQFPAENAASCPDAAVTTLNHNWTDLASKVNAMDPGGSTNQAIGVANGWQMLTTGNPYSTGSLPAGTSKVLILFSDGLNTQDRWYGNGSTEGTTEDGYIDTRENATCTAAKADGVTVYAIFIHIGTNGSSTALQNCASDSTKFYDLTASSQIKTAFADIAQKITNLRVSQ